MCLIDKKLYELRLKLKKYIYFFSKIYNRHDHIMCVTRGVIWCHLKFQFYY